MPPTPNAYQLFSERVSLLRESVKKLPKSTPLSKKSDIIPSLFKKIPIPADPAEHFEVFNRRLDILYGENLRNETTGRLPNITRGEHGMDMVVNYITEEMEGGFLIWDVAQIKVDRLIGEIQAILNRETKASRQPKVTEVTDDEDDGDYHLPKRRRIDDDDDDDGPIIVHVDSNGEEIVEETDLGENLRKKRAAAKEAKKAKKASATNSATATKSAPKAKTKKTQRTRSKKANDDPLPDLIPDDDSGDESDGLEALRKVEVVESSHGSRRGPPNQSLQHFHEAVPTVDAKGGKRWEFKCKICGSKQRVARTEGAETFDDEPKLPKLGNLSAHATSCLEKEKERKGTKPDDDTPTQPSFNWIRSAELMEGYLKEGELNPAIIADQAGFFRIFSAWILDESLPWTTGESPTLAMLFKYLKVKFKLPTDTTVRNYLAKIFSELHGMVVREFTNVKSKIAYSTDTWTTKQMVYTFACTVGSFVDDDWNLIERVVDFKPLAEKEHEGLYAGLAFVNGARERGGLNKMSVFNRKNSRCLTSVCVYFISLTTDNATVNDVIVKTVARCLLTRYGIPESTDRHIRCIAHVINLVVQAFLAGMDEGEDPEDFDWFGADKNAPLYYTPDEDQDQIDLENQADTDEQDERNPSEPIPIDKELEELQKLIDADRAAVEEDEISDVSSQSAIKKLRFIVNKIVSSPQRRLKFRKIARKKYTGNPKTERLARLMAVRDVRTRWNYTHAMIRRALLMREAVDDWVYESNIFRGAALNPADWKLLEQVADILEPFTQATQQMSRSSTPTIPFVLPLYESLHAHLLEVSNDRTKFNLRTRQGATAGLNKLLKYKNMASENQFYMLGTILHPYFRSQWFRQTAASKSMSSQDEAVDKAEALFHQVAETYFTTEIEAVSTHSDRTQEIEDNDKSANNLDTNTDPHHDWFSNMMSFDIPDTPQIARNPKELFEEELRRYFAFGGGRETYDYNPLLWWKSNEGSFPTIARMARDFLAIPATSVSVERTFSKSRHICSDLRSSLKEETIKKALLSKVWIKDGLFKMVAPTLKRKRHGTE